MDKLIERIKNIKHKKLVIALIIIVLLFVLGFPRLGNWLVEEDEIVESDIIIVLMGSVPDRILEAVDIYSQGYSDKIIMVNSHMVGYDTLLSRGVEVPGDAQRAMMAATELGVKEDDIKILPGETRSTQDEALIIREYLDENKDIDSIILVTSKYHSARTERIFTKALKNLDKDILITSRPSKYDEFNSQDWWRNREDIQRVITEYIKFANFYLREQFQL